ncbi:MAG: 2,3-diphosphoglycerate-dependent phosphoglycerate mutase [candidate division Zixibacteria bacterium]|nr:2,3-diphosphoglycerate-dependent phosphoglycerate mutase [candidate division Zixibacteria bacterium]
MFKLVLLRHGESVWNQEKRFTGWIDVDLTDRGVAEAQEAARILMEAGLSFDIAFTSVLKRAIRTLWIVQEAMDLMWIPVIKSWRFNERHYGGLQGIKHADMAAKYGAEQVHRWRRSYTERPPALDEVERMKLRHDPRYRHLADRKLPEGECLKDTYERFLPFWHRAIAPEIAAGNRVLISGHGNSLRALVKHLGHISNEEIVKLNIPTGIPLVYELDEELEPVRHYYLGNASEIQKAIDSVAQQAKDNT